MNKQIEYYQGEFLRRRMPRREFLGRITAMGLSAAAVGSIMAKADKALAATPVKGGRMRIGWYTHSANDTFNPNRLTTSLDFTRAYQVASALVRYGEDLSAQPDLAVSWEASDDATVWRFKLRQGVEFHNGKTVTPEDVIYSLGRHIGEDSDSIIKAWLSSIEEMTKDGNDTVVIRLNGPNADLPMYLGDMHAAIMPDGFTDFDNMIGSGPFKVKNFRPGVGLLAEKNPNYHFEGFPHVDEVETFGIGDTSARVNALLAGDIHFTVRVDPKTIGIINGAPGVTMANAKSSRHLTLPMMADRAPTDNHDLRQALRLLVDRKAVLENIQKGYGAMGNDTPIGPADRYYCKEIPQREIDLDKAKYHLKQAGMENGSVDLHTSEAAGGTQAPDIALLMNEAASKIGFNINLVREPTDGYWANVWLKVPFHQSNWMPRPTADLRFSLAYISEAKWNEGGFYDEAFDNVIKEARGVLDGPKRHEMYCEAQRILWERGGSIIPLFTDWLDARSERLGGWKGHPVGEGDGFRIGEWGWIES